MPMLDAILSLPDLSNKIIVICGPTASGKSKLALELAISLGGIIINADAMQVYKELPILTAQPSTADHQAATHVLYSILHCVKPFSVGIWLDLVHHEISLARSKALNTRIPIIVGGSGLYIKSLVDGLAHIPAISQKTKASVENMTNTLTPKQLHDELKQRDRVLAERLAVNDIKRITRGLVVFEETKKPLSEWQQNTTKLQYERKDFAMIYIKPERNSLYHNCNARFINMIEQGAIEEVKKLCVHTQSTAYPQILGLHEILSFIKKEISLDEAINKGQQRTRNYAKRQLTWFNHQIQYDLVL